MCVILLVPLAGAFVYTTDSVISVSGDLHTYLTDYRDGKYDNVGSIILIGGSSLNGLGIREESLETLLGREVVKVPMAGGTPWEQYMILRRYPEEFHKVDILILDLDPRHWIYVKDNPNPYVRQSRFCRLATWADISDFSFFDIMRVYLFSYRKNIKELLDIFGNMHRARMDSIWDNDAFENIKDNLAQDRKARATIDLPKANELHLDARAQKFAMRLVEFCKEHHILLVFNIPHYRPDYAKQIQYMYEWPPFVAFMAKLEANENVAIVRSPASFRDMGYDVDDDLYFLDYGHMSREGAQMYTNWLAHRLQVIAKTNHPSASK